MRLELRWSDVDELAAPPPRVSQASGSRSISIGLRALLSADPRLTGIRPTSCTRASAAAIGRVFDVIAPRAKLDGGEDFPGVLGVVAKTGPRTHAGARGRGGGGHRSADGQRRHAGRDRHGRAERRALGLRHHPQPRDLAWPAPGTERSDIFAAVRLATAEDRGCAWRGPRAQVEPDRVEVFALPALAARSRRKLSHLPRVAYVFQIHSHQRPTGLDEGILYGDPVRRMLADDRASQRGPRRRRAPRLHGPQRHHWATQNHPVIRAL